MTMSYLSDKVNNISLSNCIYEWAVGTRHIAKCWYDWNNARRGEKITLCKLQISDNTTFCCLMRFYAMMDAKLYRFRSVLCTLYIVGSCYILS